MAFLTPFFLVGLGGHRHPRPDSSDSAREEARHRVSVADVRAAHSVPVGPPPPDPPLGAAAAARGGDRADRRGVRASVLPAGRAGGRPSPAARARSSSCSISRPAWATATTGSARATRRARRRRAVWAPTIAPTLVLFARNAEENMRATSDRDAARGGASARRKSASGATRYGPALKLADSILSRSPIKRREAVLISDFQRSGWSGSEEVRFPEGMTVSTFSVASPSTANLAVPSVTFARASFSGQERITVTAGLSNKGDDAGEERARHADDRRPRNPDRARDRRAARVGLGSFTQFTLAGAERARLDHRPGTDPLPADNAFHFVLAPSEPVSLVIVDSGDRADASLFLSKALAIGTTPAFQVDVTTASRLTPATFDKRAVVDPERHDVPPGRGRQRAEAIRRTRRRPARRRRRSHHVAAGRSELCCRAVSARPSIARRAAAARSATSTTAIRYSRCSRRRAAATSPPRTSSATARSRPSPTDRVLARFDDGAIAAAERKIGAGRVIVVDVHAGRLVDRHRASSRCSCPLVHQLVRYLAHYEPPPSWFTVGQVLDLARAGVADRADRIVVTPSGERITQSAPARRRGLLELNEQGVYEVRAAGATDRPAAKRSPSTSIRRSRI